MTTIKLFLKDLLKSNDLNIKFKKLDGTERKMLCTLRQDVLPPISENKKAESTPKEENVNVLPVWDLEKKAFRSFRVDYLIEYTISNA